MFSCDFSGFFHHTWASRGFSESFCFVFLRYLIIGLVKNNLSTNVCQALFCIIYIVLLFRGSRVLQLLYYYVHSHIHVPNERTPPSMVTLTQYNNCNTLLPLNSNYIVCSVLAIMSSCVLCESMLKKAE